jgi:type I restriction enzyme S subunit
MQEIEKKKSEMRGKVPAGWLQTKLGEVCEKILVGIATEVKPHVREIGVPIVRNQNIREDFFDDSEMIFISEEFDQSNRNKRIKTGDILIVRTGSNVGQACIVPLKYNSSQTFTTLIIRVGNKIDSKFLSFHINSFGIKEVERLSVGGGKPNLNAGFLKEYQILLPPLPEQRAIADCLSTWDEAIQTAEELIRQKELQKKWLMQQLLTGKKRLKGFSGEWRFIRFKEIYSQVKEKVGARSFLTLSVTKGGIVSQEEYFKKEISSDDTSNYLVVEKGNMVMSGLNFWMGSIDVLTHFDSGKVSPAYKVFEIINDTISPELMKIFVRSQLMLEALIGSSVIGASIVRRNMDRETLDEWSFKIPSLEEQQAIASILSESNRELDLLRKRLAKLQEQKKGLMQVLLTGKRRLNLKK